MVALRADLAAVGNDRAALGGDLAALGGSYIYKNVLSTRAV